MAWRSSPRGTARGAELVDDPVAHGLDVLGQIDDVRGAGAGELVAQVAARHLAHLAAQPLERRGDRAAHDEREADRGDDEREADHDERDDELVHGGVEARAAGRPCVADPLRLAAERRAHRVEAGLAVVGAEAAAAGPAAIEPPR